MTSFSNGLSFIGRREQSSALRRFIAKMAATRVRYASMRDARDGAALQLRHMSDAMLRDIGITRFDIDGRASGRS